MPFPLAALLPAIGSVVSNGLNAVATSRANKQNIAFQREMYSRQRADALADFNMQNAYNSPAAMMQRYKDAGINPNLVVGGGAANVSASVRSSSPGSANIQAPRFDLSGLGESMLQAMQFMKTQAEADKIKAATELMKTQEKATSLGMDLTKVRIGRETVDLTQAARMAPVQYEQAQANVAKTLADTKFTLDSNDRAELMQASNLKEALVRMAAARLQMLNTVADTNLKRQALDTNEATQAKLWVDIANGKLDAKIKEFEISLNKKGLTKSDPAYMRALNEFLENTAKSIPRKLSYIPGSVYDNYPRK